MRNYFKHLSFYLGLAPLYPALWRIKKPGGATGRHFRQAMSLFFLNLVVFFVFVLLWVGLKQIVMQHYSAAIEQYMFFNIFITDYIWILMALFNLFLFGVAAVSVFSARNRHVPLLTWLSKYKVVVIIGFCWNVILILSLLLIILLAWHSLQLAANPSDQADVYMLYDDMGVFPRWLFTLGFYRVSSVARDQWGHGHVYIGPITHASLKYALDNGRLIFLSVHGSASGNEFTGFFRYKSADRQKVYYVGPEQIARIGFGPRLEYIYLAACNSGHRAKEWGAVFAPATIVTFDRISTFPDHLYWLFNTGPKTVKFLP